MEVQSARAELRAGWPALSAAAIGVATGVAALPYNTQGLFVGALNHEFGWSRFMISAILLGGGFVLALSSPVAGALVDRFGARGPIGVAYAALVLGFFALSEVSGAYAMFVALQLGLLLLGSATGPVSFTRIVNQHFARMRGFALGITLAGSGVMALVGPPAVAAAIEEHGWRAGYRLIAIIILTGAVLTLALLSIQRHPGTNAGTTAQARAAPVPMAQLIRSRLLWRLALIFFVLAMGIGGYTFHMVPLLTDSGLTLVQAARIASLIGLAMLLGRLATGLLVDRFFAPKVAAVVMLLAGVGLAALAIGGAPVAPVAAFLIGFAMGAEGDVIGYLTARYFGLQAYGRLYGLLYGAYTVGLGLSPLIIAALQQRIGSYVGGLWLSVGLLLVGTYLIVRLPQYDAVAEDLPCKAT